MSGMGSTGMTSKTKIRFLGVAGYEITTSKGQIIYVDPFLDENPGAPFKSHNIERADLILVSHAAYDHMGDAEKIAKRTGAPVVCSADVEAYFRAKEIPETQIRSAIWGVAFEIAGIRVQPVECHHWSHIKLPNGQLATGIPLGFVVYADPDLRFYHYGDSALFSDLKLIGELYKPNVGAIGIANPTEIEHLDKSPGKLVSAEMSPREGVMAAQWLGLDVVLPCHYINPREPEVAEFGREIEKAEQRGERAPRSVVMKPGDVLAWPPVPAGD